mmetsp:Transcript_3115/g.7347  ORF Transcript_3115/g.7347 Transcript_3115/m.7347 type:complete len:98 (-) Transcript_3115:155-448(-)
MRPIARKAEAAGRLTQLNTAVRKGQCRVNIKCAQDDKGHPTNQLAEISLNGPQCDALIDCYLAILNTIHTVQEQNQDPKKKRYVEKDIRCSTSIPRS